MIWLESDTVLTIHNKIIEATGGVTGLRDKNLLESALYAPLATFGGEDLYVDIFQKVAVLPLLLLRIYYTYLWL